MNTTLFFHRLAGYLTVEKLHEMYDEQLGADTIDNIIITDSTYQGGDQIGSYTPWLIKMILSQEIDLDQLDAVNETLKLFDRYKRNLEIRDIYQYHSFEELLNALQPYLPQTGQPVEKSEDILYNDDTWILVVPYTFEAECEWGKGTKWCTTDYHGKESGRTTFDTQLSQKSFLFILINKKTGEKYQFDDVTNQFQDSHNQGAFSKFLESNPSYELLTIIQKVAPNLFSKKVNDIRSEEELKIEEKLNNLNNLQQLVNLVLAEFGIDFTFDFLNNAQKPFDEKLLDELLEYRLATEINWRERNDILNQDINAILNRLRSIIPQILQEYSGIISALVNKGFDISSRNPNLVRNKELGISLDPLTCIPMRGTKLTQDDYEKLIQDFINHKLELKNKKNLPRQIVDVSQELNSRYNDMSVVELGKNLLDQLPETFTFNTVKQLEQENENIFDLIEDIDRELKGSWSITRFNDRFQRFMYYLERAGLVKKFQNTYNKRIYWERQY